MSVVNVSNYNLFRRDRSSTGGGVCIYVRADILASEVNDEFLNDSGVEQVWAEIKAGDEKILVGCMYRPPRFMENNKINVIIKHVHDLIKSKKYDSFMLAGDFNYPKIDWNIDAARIDIDEGPEREFLDMLDDCFISQSVDFPTFQTKTGNFTNVLDLILSDNSERVVNVERGPPLGCLEKAHVTLTWEFLLANKVQQTTRELQANFLYKKGDYLGMEEEFDKVDWNTLFERKDAEECYKLFLEIYSTMRERFIPVYKSTGISRPKWMTRDVLVAIRNKKRLYKKFLAGGCKHEKLKADYIAQRQATNRLIRNSIKSFEQKLAVEAKTNSKAIFAYVKERQSTPTTIKGLLDKFGSLVETPEKIANVLNEQFQSVFTHDDDSELPIFNRTDTICSDILGPLLSVEEIMNRLSCLDKHKAAGNDQVHPHVLSSCSKSLAMPLSIIFQKSFDDGVLPTDWKKSNVVPIYKKGLRKIAENYRPVSLTSVPCKVFEGILRDVMMTHLLNNELISDAQHGFVPKRSCVTNLLEFLDFITGFLDKGIPMDVIYLDFAKAFDKVSHRKLTHKLQGYGFRGKILKWIENFLHGRLQRVVYDGVGSEWLLTESGVPQGSVLSPLLFVVFINDLPGILDSMTKLYADDSKFGRRVESSGDIELLQKDLDSVQKWCEVWSMKLNEAKCKVMHLGKKNQRGCYKLTNSDSLMEYTLESSSCEKDLGLLFSDNLKWSAQVSTSAAKANQMLGLLKRTFKFWTPSTFSLLYKSLIRPQLEFANSVWNPCFHKDINILEKVQKRATKLIPVIRHLDYESRCNFLGLTSLEERRKRGDLIQFYKIRNGLDSVKFSNEPVLIGRNGPSNVSSNLRRAGLVYEVEASKTNIRRHFFTNRAIKLWNELPIETTMSTNLNSFKNSLDNFAKIY
jgi:hypothetical protein